MVSEAMIAAIDEHVSKMASLTVDKELTRNLKLECWQRFGLEKLEKILYTRA